MSSLFRTMLVALAVVLSTTGSGAAQSTPADLRAGHWVRVKGALNANGVFDASAIGVRKPKGDESLVGTVPDDGARAGVLRLFGQEIHTSARTQWQGVEPNTLQGSRIKVQGRYRGPRNFSAREIEARKPGRDRIEGRIEWIKEVVGGRELGIMNFRVFVPTRLEVEHKGSLARIPLAEARLVEPREIVRKWDDPLDSVLLTDNLRLGGRLGLAADRRQDFDLDDTAAKDRGNLGLRARMRVTWDPSSQLSLSAEAKYQRLWRFDQNGANQIVDRAVLGETFIYLRNMIGTRIDAQIGRQDFDDAREWIYDQNLDGVRLIRTVPLYRLELGASTTLSDGRPRDEAATNLSAFLSTNGVDRSVAVWAMHRDFDLATPESFTHVGVRALGDWLPENESWLDLSYVSGAVGSEDVTGWGIDAGTIWSPRGSSLSGVVGIAFGSGDSDSSNGTRSFFRQTGLQDNTDKLGTVTSVQYYGELLDPELANLIVATAGISTRIGNRTSLSLIGHHYQQARGAPTLFDTRLRMSPSGIDPFLGWELDLILGTRRWDGWSVEAVGSVFVPGGAFPASAANAYYAKLQIRYFF